MAETRVSDSSSSIAGAKAGSPASALALCAMGALAMSYGWGFRGDYGHESGAMIPGALMAMGVCICSGRPEWHGRGAIIGLCGALGWSLGGQMSYGQITSYTVSHSFPDVYYGYASLFAVGMFWGGIGSAILALALTRGRAELERFFGPLVAVFGTWFVVWLLMWFRPGLAGRFDAFTEGTLHDTDWLAATLTLVVAGIYRAVSRPARAACTLVLILAAGWWVGYVLLVWVLDLHMSPTPSWRGVRSDNWAGCAGMLVALATFHLVQRNRAGLMLTLYGAIAGGIGFSVGDFINKSDKVRWEPLYQYEWFRGFDHWKWTEQSFGFMMGLGVALGLLRLLRGNLVVAGETTSRRRIDYLGAFTLLVAMLWMTLHKNVRNWAKPNVRVIPSSPIFGLEVWVWFLLFGVCLSLPVLFALRRHHQRRLPLAPASALGKSQLLFFFVLWVSAVGVLLQAFTGLGSKGGLFVHGSFWASCVACTLLALHNDGSTVRWSNAPGAAPDDLRWQPGWRHGVLWISMPVLMAILTGLTMSMHDGPEKGSRLRFGPEAFQHLSEKEWNQR